jgi:hypothetical protein
VVNEQTINLLKEEFERAARIMQHGLYPCQKLFQPYESGSGVEPDTKKETVKPWSLVLNSAEVSPIPEH